MTDEEAVLAAAARIIDAETQAEFDACLHELDPYIRRWVTIYRFCINRGMPDDVAAHYVKLLMGQEVPPT